MRRSLLFSISLRLFLCILAVSCISKKPADRERPNVIIILTDDQGYGDLSCHGNPVLKTPALDKLAEESVSFTDFHVSSICTPTRSQLLTGKDACRNGAFAWAYSREIIHAGVPTMAEIFKANGYATGHFGKWHLGDNYPNRPMDRGFDESIKHGGASIYQTPDYWDNDYMDDHYEHNGVMKQYRGYCTDVWFEEAKKILLKSKQEERQFFVYLPTNAPHGPLIVPETYSQGYYEQLQKGFEQVPEFVSEKDRSQSIAWFFGMIANIDENIGKLDAFLTEQNLAENTILIFMTDNGGTAGVPVFNAGMRGRKTSLYDGGHRVPFFVRWPEGKFSTPGNINQLSHSQDLLPTLIDLCELESETPDFDGVSLKELLLNSETELPDRMLVMQNARAPRPTKYDAAVLWEKWRLVRNTELYNIASDPAQKDNMIGKNPEIAGKMQEHYEKWWEEIQASLDKVPHIPVGGEQCSSITLTCFDWHGFEGDGNVTIQPTVRRGGSADGIWNVEVLEDGEYEIRCSRWPEEAKTAMTAGLPEHKTLTITYPEGKAMPVRFAVIKVNNEEKLIQVSQSDYYTSAVFKLKKGKYTLRTTLLNKNRELVCGAYYAYVNKL